VKEFLRAVSTGHRATPDYFEPALVHGQGIGQFLSRHFLSMRLSGLEHVPREGPVLVAGNHTGFLDGPLVMSWFPRPLRVLTKVQIYKGVVSSYLHHIGQIPLDRDVPDRSALRLCLRELEAGRAVGIFPEGTRGAGELREVKDGVAYLAAHSQAPIVPVACFGTQAALPKGARWPDRHAPVSIVFGAPFQVPVDGDPDARATLERMGEQIRVRLLEHLEQAQTRAQAAA
jgi:1-acyl-sn-glycerol-3-phosphate acyltransferase